MVAAQRGAGEECGLADRLLFHFADLLDKMVTAEIHADVMGSDHCPISLTLDF